jgi:dTDP-4-dehydrorhamnose reductase
MPGLSLWGGVECTVARIGDTYKDQLAETGHRYRLEDLDRIASLGVRTLRYPIVWESISPDCPDACDWTWHDERLRRLDVLGIRVIGGLVHHGSGPRYTNLLDPDFPRMLAVHARRVAERYPWLELLTPVNEPLTTARFSCLYGHWYPHARDDRSFLRALVNQCWAVVLAMRAVRHITPAAKLIQTEDIGKTFSTPRLRYQADLENARRWLSLDLLCGRVDRHHPLRALLLTNGIAESELDGFCEQPCAPDVIGVNHYLTSERYLHSHVRAFPDEFAGGNGRDRYADVEAVRMPIPGDEIGPEARLGEVWNRYQIPIAVTEAHHGSTREEQLRWLVEVWNAAARLRRKGVDMRAVTSWALFGAVDWNSLLTRNAGFYEPGAFDVRNRPPRLTAIGKAVQSLARHGNFDHPVIAQPGWWRRPERYYRPISNRDHEPRLPSRYRLVIAGDDTGLTRVFETAVRIRGLEHIRVSTKQLDGLDLNRLVSMLSERRPWALIDGRGISRAPQLESGADLLAAACAKLGVPLAMISGPRMREPLVYVGPSRDGAVPVSERNGWTELEQGVSLQHQESLIVRDGPTSVDALLDLLIDGERGLWEPSKTLLVNQESPSTVPSLTVAKPETQRGLSLPQ